MDRNGPARRQHAVFALGCLWGADPVFGGLDGVMYTCVGFAGGDTPAPTHADIGDHREAVRVTFDPTHATYADLLDAFRTAHDPTQAPAKHRYQPALFPQTAQQAQKAQAVVSDNALDVPIPSTTCFHAAAPRHQNYKLRRHDILMEAFRARIPSEPAFARSPAATLVNAYVSGHRAPHRLDDDRQRLGLPPDALHTVRRLARRHQGWEALVQAE